MHILNKDIEFVEENRSCSYFDENISDIRYKYMYSCSTTQYQGMLERGWRRFGRMHLYLNVKLVQNVFLCELMLQIINFLNQKKE